MVPGSLLAFVKLVIPPFPGPVFFLFLASAVFFKDLQMLSVLGSIT